MPFMPGPARARRNAGLPFPTEESWAMSDEIASDELALEVEHIWIAPVDRDAEPVDVRIPIGLDPGKILDAPAASAADEGLIDPEVMSVAVDEDDGAAVIDGAFLEGGQHFIEAEPDAVG